MNLKLKTLEYPKTMSESEEVEVLEDNKSEPKIQI